MMMISYDDFNTSNDCNDDMILILVMMILIHGNDEDEADHCYIVVQWIIRTTMYVLR